MRRSGEIAFRDVQELEREVVHLGGEQLHAAREVVVEVDGRNGGEEAGRRRDQRLGNPRSHDPEVGRSGLRRCPGRRP